MINETHSKVPGWFWILAIVAVLWNLIGVASYIMDATLSQEALAQMSDAQSSLRDTTPGWVTGCYAVAVFAGLLGSVALLIRKGWAIPLFGISLASVVIQMCYVFGVMNATSVLGAAAMILPAVIILFGAFLLWFSIRSKKRGWVA